MAFGVIFGGIGRMLYLKEMGVLPSNGPWVVLLMLGLFGLVFLLTQYFATAKMVITMGDEGIRRVWETQFPGNWRADEDIKWAEVTEYLYQPEKNYQVFKITLTAGRVIKLYRAWYAGKDDFTRFRKDFVQKVEERNRSGGREGVKIRMSRSFYESKTAYVIAIIGVVLLVVASLVVLALSFYRGPHFGNFVSLGAGYTMVLYFVAMVYRYRQTRRELAASESAVE